MAEFVAQIDKWIAANQERIRAVKNASIQRVIEIAQEPVGGGGNMPVDTGFLRASFRVGLDAPAPGPSTPPSTAGREPGSAPLFSAPVLGPELATVALGQVVFVTTNVEYAAYLEYLDRQRRYGKFAGQSTVFIAPIELRWPRIVEDALRRNVQGNPRGVRFP